MARFDSEERADFEFGHGTETQFKKVVCPNCKSGRTVNKNWYSGICKRCNKYFNEKQSLSIEQANEWFDTSDHIISPEFIKLKEGMEKRAYDFRDKQIKLRKEGKVLSHEPDGKPRKWGKK